MTNSSRIQVRCEHCGRVEVRTEIGMQCACGYDETAELLADKEFMEGFRLGVAQLDAGEFIYWEDLKKELGLGEDERP